MSKIDDILEVIMMTIMLVISFSAGVLLWWLAIEFASYYVFGYDIAQAFFDLNK